MSFILYKNSKGEIIKVPANMPFRKGKDWEEVGTEMTQQEKQLEDSVSKIARAVGLSVDETITKLTKALGIEKCPRCQLRSQILKEMGKLGWVETLRRLKATFRS